MSEKFVFHGQTTFIDKPRDTVIQNFQNNYLVGDGSDKDKVITEIIRLTEIILKSQDLTNSDKEDTVQALSVVAEQIKEEKGSKISLKSTLQSIQEIVSKAADIATPAIGITATILKLLHLG